MSTTKNVALETVNENPANTITVNPSMGPMDFMSKVRMGAESLFKVTPVAQKSYSKAFADLGLSTSGNAAIDNAIGALALTLKDDAKNQVRISSMLAYIDGNDLYKRFRDVNGDAFKSMKAFLTSGKMEELTGGESAYSTLQNLLNVGATFYLPYYAGDERYGVFTEISPSKLISLVSLSKQTNYKGFLDDVFSGKKFESVGKTLPEMSVREIQKVASSLKPKKQERKTGQGRNGNAATESLNVKTDNETPKPETPKPETPKPETPKAEQPETPKEESKEDVFDELTERLDAIINAPDPEQPETPQDPLYAFQIAFNDGSPRMTYTAALTLDELADRLHDFGAVTSFLGGNIAMFLPDKNGTHSRAYVGLYVNVDSMDSADKLKEVRRAAPEVVKSSFNAFMQSL